LQQNQFKFNIMDLSSPRASLRFMKEFDKICSPVADIERFFDPSVRSELTLDAWKETIVLFQESEQWENVAFACLLYIHAFGINLPADDNIVIAEMAIIKMHSFLQHIEPRVRSTAAKLIGMMSTKLGFFVYTKLRGIIHACVLHDHDREVLTRPVVLGNETELALDEVTGWRALESSYTAFKELVYGMQQYVNSPARKNDVINEGLSSGGSTNEVSNDLCSLRWTPSSKIAPLQQQDIDVFLTGAALHVNRYVRQAGCELIQVMCAPRPLPPPCVHPSVDLDHKTSQKQVKKSDVKIDENEPSGELILGVCQMLAVGLQDSWCQVRLVATQATSTFLAVMNTQYCQFPGLENDIIWPYLLPRLCLNRHYCTDSVRDNAHRAWKGGMGSRGRTLLCEHIEATVGYYLSMSRHKNHMVCEAACAAMAELGKLTNMLIAVLLVWVILRTKGSKLTQYFLCTQDL
jgi:hypothetical protein